MDHRNMIFAHIDKYIKNHYICKNFNFLPSSLSTIINQSLYDNYLSND